MYLGVVVVSRLVEMEPPVCEFCGDYILTDEQGCPALDKGRCHSWCLGRYLTLGTPVYSDEPLYHPTFEESYRPCVTDDTLYWNDVEDAHLYLEETLYNHQEWSGLPVCAGEDEYFDATSESERVLAITLMPHAGDAAAGVHYEVDPDGMALLTSSVGDARDGPCDAVLGLPRAWLSVSTFCLSALDGEALDLYDWETGSAFI